MDLRRQKNPIRPRGGRGGVRDAGALLGEDDPPVFRIERAAARSPFVLTCDHAGREIPHKLNGLGLSEHDRSTHVAWDVGVAELGRRLSARLDAFLILHNYSRLVIDCTDLSTRAA